MECSIATATSGDLSEDQAKWFAGGEQCVVCYLLKSFHIYILPLLDSKPSLIYMYVCSNVYK